jgi:hypothetical protein
MGGFPQRKLEYLRLCQRCCTFRHCAGCCIGVLWECEGKKEAFGPISEIVLKGEVVSGDLCDIVAVNSPPRCESIAVKNEPLKKAKGVKEHTCDCKFE